MGRCTDEKLSGGLFVYWPFFWINVRLKFGIDRLKINTRGDYESGALRFLRGAHSNGLVRHHRRGEADGRPTAKCSRVYIHVRHGCSAVWAATPAAVDVSSASKRALLGSRVRINSAALRDLSIMERMR